MYFSKRIVFIKFFLFVALGLLVSGCNSVTGTIYDTVDKNHKVVSSSGNYDLTYYGPAGKRTVSFQSETAAREFIEQNKMKDVEWDVVHIRVPAPPSIQSKVTDDIISTGNSPAQVSIPMAACSFLVNSQNVCTETNVTTATAIISVAVLGGIIALVTTAVNNQANSNEQRQKDNNLLLALLAIQNKSTGAKVCYDSATPPNVIPCP